MKSSQLVLTCCVLTIFCVESFACQARRQAQNNNQNQLQKNLQRQIQGRIQTGIQNQLRQPGQNFQQPPQVQRPNNQNQGGFRIPGLNQIPGAPNQGRPVIPGQPVQPQFQGSIQGQLQREFRNQLQGQLQKLPRDLRDPIQILDLGNQQHRPVYSPRMGELPGGPNDRGRDFSNGEQTTKMPYMGELPGEGDPNGTNPGGGGFPGGGGIPGGGGNPGMNPGGGFPGVGGNPGGGFPGGIPGEVPGVVVPESFPGSNPPGNHPEYIPPTDDNLRNPDRHGVIPGAVDKPVNLDANRVKELNSQLVRLIQYSRQMKDQYQRSLEGEKHADKLQKDITTLEQQATDLLEVARNAVLDQNSIGKFRGSANQFLQLSYRIGRTIELTQPWLRTDKGHIGIQQMRVISRRIVQTALYIDAYLPVDKQVIDGQAQKLQFAIKELNNEFQLHLQNYEVSPKLSQDIVAIDKLVRHMQQLSHNTAWNQLDFVSLAYDIVDVKEMTNDIERLFDRQAEIGVRTEDWVGIVHSRDAITDVLAAAYLFERMIRKTLPRRRAGNVNPSTPPPQRSQLRTPAPLRDLYGNPIDQGQPGQAVPADGNPIRDF